MPKTIQEIWPFAVDLIAAREEEVDQKELRNIVKAAVASGPRIVDEIGTLKQAHQVGHRPPQFLVFVKDPNKIPESFRRYLVRSVRARYGFRGNPIRWVFRRRGE